MRGPSEPFDEEKFAKLQAGSYGIWLKHINDLSAQLKDTIEKKQKDMTKQLVKKGWKSGMTRLECEVPSDLPQIWTDCSGYCTTPARILGCVLCG